MHLVEGLSRIAIPLTFVFSCCLDQSLRLPTRAFLVGPRARPMGVAMLSQMEWDA